MALTLTRLNVRPLNGSIVRPYVAASAVSVGDWVALDVNDKVVKARANAVGTTYAIGMVVSIEGYMPGTDAAAEQTVGVCVFGPVAGFTGMNAVLPLVYLSAATAGASTQTLPTGGTNFVYMPARAIRSDVLFICPPTIAAIAAA